MHEYLNMVSINPERRSRARKNCKWALFASAVTSLIFYLNALSHLGMMPSSEMEKIMSSNESKADDDDSIEEKHLQEDSIQDPSLDPNAEARISHFKETAKSFFPVTDKIGGGGRDKHRYHNMYGTFLLPLAASKPAFKFLEIGLGCNMEYGAGASVKIWKKLFPQAELWEAEYDEKCVNDAKEKGLLEGLNILVGDQADYATLDSWVEKSGGKFDAIIDDGGHGNCMISNSFDKLWPQLNPGGYYFVEDLHVGHFYTDKKECGVMGDKLKDWQEQLIFLTTKNQRRFTYPLPEDMVSVHCQAEACVFKKRSNEVNDPWDGQ